MCNMRSIGTGSIVWQLGWLLAVGGWLGVMCTVESVLMSRCAVKDCYCERRGDQIEVDCSVRSLEALPDFDDIQVYV